MSLAKLNAEQTLALGHKITTVLAGEGAGDYGVPVSAVSLLSGLDGSLSSAISQQSLLMSQTKASTAAKATQRDATAAQIASIHATVLNNPSVSDDMLITLGFAPRRAGKPQPLVVSPVTGLVAEPGALSTVSIHWDRGFNAQGTMFVIETSADALSWTMIKSTTRASYLAEGFAPGVAVYFRVTATTSTSASLPSQAVGVYLPPPPARVELKVA